MSNGEVRGQIPAPVLPPATGLLKFSFRHLDLETDKFLISECSLDFLSHLLQKIRELSSWTVEQFCEQNNRENRHIINFPDTTEPDGFRNVDTDQLAYHESWQFQLTRQEDWRVHGILIDDTFFVVWLDPNHRLYAR